MNLIVTCETAPFSSRREQYDVEFEMRNGKLAMAPMELNEVYANEGFKQSPHGVWYPTIVRRKLALDLDDDGEKESDEVVRFRPFFDTDAMPSAHAALLAVVVLATSNAGLADDANSAKPFLGSWAFELPDGNPAWLQIRHEDGTLGGSLLWSVGSARPVRDLGFHDGRLAFTRRIRWKPFGRSDDTRVISKPMTAALVGDRLQLSFSQTAAEGGDEEASTFAVCTRPRSSIATARCRASPVPGPSSDGSPLPTMPASQEANGTAIS